VTMAMQLSACAIAAVLISMAVLALLANVLLKTMDRTWDEGKKAIEREKEQLCGVITAMYPPQVAKRMLAGETHIVYNVGCAAVFFSDIYEFTTASNTITPEQLIQFLGYTFGLMDVVADAHRVHKVKTIGDAYLAVSGLPGTESVHDNSTLDMMLFASCCVQLFGQRFVHPDEGTIMDTVAHNLFERKQHTKMPEVVLTPGRPTPAAVMTKPAAAPADGNPMAPMFIPKTHCTMRYGVSAGPITAGVLQGKTPLFDIWGRTVNLASRMESTGQPGRIQVAEGVYQTIVALKDQPFSFDARHKVFCKGFGNVSAYFVSTCTVPPPKELLTSLHVEPNFGNFYFDNPVPGFKTMAREAAPTSSSAHNTSSHGSSKGTESINAAELAARRPRATATL
jgi:class 3 adenylate cyclase